MDVVSDVLRTVRMRGAFFFDIEAHSPWGSTVPTVADIAHRVMPEHEIVVPFHVITEGSCWSEITDDIDTPLKLSAGDIVIFPRGNEHVFASSPGYRYEANPSNYDPLPGRKRSLRYVVKGESDGPVACRYVCGYFGCDAGPFNPLLDALPRMFRAQATASTQGWLATLARAGVDQSEKAEAGGDVMLARLAELMFVEIIRQHTASLRDDALGWFAGLRDRHVGEALGLIHERPTTEWTLESLARTVGLSRSVFAERFNELVGMPAAQYLARWRLTLAARLLDDPALSLAQVGTSVGYNSEAAFQRAFKRHVGTPPGIWRKTAQSRRSELPQR